MSGLKSKTTLVAVTLAMSLVLLITLYACHTSLADKTDSRLGILSDTTNTDFTSSPTQPKSSQPHSIAEWHDYYFNTAEGKDQLKRDVWSESQEEIQRLHDVFLYKFTTLMNEQRRELGEAKWALFIDHLSTRPPLEIAFVPLSPDAPKRDASEDEWSSFYKSSTDGRMQFYLDVAEWNWRMTIPVLRDKASRILAEDK